jgi:predicted ABC-type ATPase
MLKSNPEQDAILYAGGSGSGKTSVVKKLMPEAEEGAAAVLDGNLSKYDTAVNRIDEAKAAGKTPEIVYVYREQIDAWENGVVKRMVHNIEEGGRVVPMSVFLENHRGSWKVAKRLLDEGFEVKLLDNSLGKGNEAFKRGFYEYRQIQQYQV